MTEEKFGKKTELDRLNELISWYEKYKPEAGKRIPVAIGPSALVKMLGVTPKVEGKKLVGEYEYRGRTIYATGIDCERR